MKVSEIFESIDGEGIRAGLPVTFIRLYGCNLRCSYCDSQYACVGNEWKEMAIEDILEEVIRLDHNCITITGGEPLVHKDIYFLIQALSSAGYKVNIETDGACDITPYIKKRNILLTVDYKCPSSDMESRMLLDNFNKVREKDVVKFVVGSDEDLECMKKVIEDFQLRCHIFVSPVFGKIEAKQIVEFLLKNKLDNVRLQLQIHKYVWDPNMRGV